MPPPVGSPDTLKPSHELYGKMLPRAARPAEAEAYAVFLRARPRADANLPELKEARGYLAHTAER
jgi:hypothetical protein